jgi:peptide/nickel transport system substrate-binding protein
VTLPFTSEAAVCNELRSSGPSALTVASLPQQYAPQASTLTAEGYNYNKAASYSFNYFPLNFHNPKVGPVFSQLYFRQGVPAPDRPAGLDRRLPVPHRQSDVRPDSALAAEPAGELFGDDDQSLPVLGLGGPAAAEQPRLEGGPGWDHHVSEPEPLRRGDQQGRGDRVQHRLCVGHRGGPGRDERPGRAGAEGRDQHQPHHASVRDGAAPRSRVSPPKPTCKWQAENWGAGWIYGPSYLPTGEQLYAPGAVANYGSYSDPSTTKLIQGVTTASDATQELTAYAKNVEQMEPVVFGHDRYVRRRCGSSGGQESRRLCGERVGSHEPRGLVLHEVVRPRSSCSRDVVGFISEGWAR